MPSMVRLRLLRRDSVRFSCLKAKAGGKGIRTPGLLIANETLYQLSYTPNYQLIRDLAMYLTIAFSALHTDLLHYRLKLQGKTTEKHSSISESGRMSLPVVKRCILSAHPGRGQGNQEKPAHN